MKTLDTICPFKPEQLLTESEIIARWNGWRPGDPVKLSIVCITYNHENYIQDAICGFLAQDYNFPIEIIIHDDASTDKTSEIIEKFYAKYPNIIRLMLQKSNQYSIGVHPWFDITFPAAKGEFIALCEGDDYWSDANKICLQIGLLENGQYSGCFHTVRVQDASGARLSNYYRFPHTAELNFGKLARSSYFATCSVVFRKTAIEWCQIPNEFLRGILGMDRVLWNVIAMTGPWIGVDTEMAVHVKHSGGVTASSRFKDKYIGLESTISVCELVVSIADKKRLFGLTHRLKAGRNLIRKLLIDCKTLRYREVMSTMQRIFRVIFFRRPFRNS